MTTRFRAGDAAAGGPPARPSDHVAPASSSDEAPVIPDAVPDPAFETTTAGRRLAGVLAGMESVVVAFSGGVDSTLLVRAAADVRGLRLVALTTRSPTNTDDEIGEARALAKDFGVEHLVVDVDELETPGYAANPAHRCYLCKQTLYPECERVARERGFAFVADGVNTDDLGDWRPGLRAAAERGVRHPLVEAGLSKAMVRELSRGYGLPTADKPASPCLSSRFPYGIAITREGLARVAAAEAALRRLGFVELRVRSLGDAARVEVAVAEIDRFGDETTRSLARSAVLGAGFATVEISATPLRSGSLNDSLDAATRSRFAAPSGTPSASLSTTPIDQRRTP